MSAPISFTFAGLPSPYCFTSPERFALDIVAGLSGFLPGNFNFFVQSEAEPVIGDRDKLWWKLNPDGSPVGRFFQYFGGQWVSRNPVVAGSVERRIYMGTEASVWSYDGGDGSNPTTTPPTDTTGAMWEVDHDFDFRVALGAGTSSTPTTVNVGDTGGNERITQTIAQMPVHNHPITAYGTNTPSNGNGIIGGGNNTTGPFTYDATTFPAQHLSIATAGSGDPMSLMNPYKGVFFIKRTARVFMLPA